MRFWKYIKGAATYRLMGIFVPPHLFIVAAFTMLGYIDSGFLIVGSGLELLYLLGLASSSRFQAVIDGQELEVTREQSQQRVQSILADLPPELTARYVALVKRCGEIIKNSGDSQEDIASIAQSLDRLLWIYLRMLRTARQLGKVVEESKAKGKNSLGAKVAELQRQRDAAQSDDVKDSIGRRLETVEDRLRIQTEASEKYDFSLSELQRIEEEVERAREKALVSTEPVAVTHQVSAITDGLDSTNRWMKEQQNIFGSTLDEASDAGPILTLQ